MTIDQKSAMDAHGIPYPERVVEKGLVNYPPSDRWEDWIEFDAASWPDKVAKRYQLIPTVCFNCEAGCGLLAYIDKETGEIRKFEGNPEHPGSRGRNCAKGPATLNQIQDPDRILYPMKRVGERGEGDWERTTWDEVLDTVAARIRKALVEERHNEIMYHVGRPGEDHFTNRVLTSWGIDGHNSHTNICSSGARAGYFFWGGFDRPSADFANAKVIFLISAHLETGHYFNPHAQRIIEGKMDGAKIIVIDPRLSNTASMCDHWLPIAPGTESILLLGIANWMLQRGRYDREFVRRWVNWEEYLAAEHKDKPQTFEQFEAELKSLYSEYTPEYVEKETGLPAAELETVAEVVADSGGKFASHVWRSAAAAHLGGWQVARTLMFLTVLTGSVGTKGGTSANSWNKFTPKAHTTPEPHKQWSPLLWPDEYPLSFYEMSFLLPHLLLDGRGSVDTYFTRVYNPVWINPDGFTWLQALRDKSKIGLHVAMTPTWNETAWFADYVLPMGHASERHDIMSQETHAGKWIAFRQPVLRVADERAGKKIEFTYESNPGEVWEEAEFWIELSWRIDPDGSLGIRKHHESPYRPGEKITITEYFQWIFENSVPGLPETAKEHGLTPLEYMQKFGAFSIVDENYVPYEKEDEAGVEIDGVKRVGFGTPSKKLEFYSQTLKDWGWPEYTVPTMIRSHVDPGEIDGGKGEMVLLPTFRLPNLIHTRSANAKWLMEISHKNPLWIHPTDADRLGLKNDDLVKVETEIGHFIIKAYRTEGIRPGVVACSHHLGRWRLANAQKLMAQGTGTVELIEEGDGVFGIKQLCGYEAVKTDDPDTERVWWTDPGVHQNITHAVHPDPISGMHCWHQKVTVTKAGPDDEYGSVRVDTKKSMAAFRHWLDMTRRASEHSPDGTKRPLWLKRPLKPVDEAYRLDI